MDIESLKKVFSQERLTLIVIVGVNLVVTLLVLTMYRVNKYSNDLRDHVGFTKWGEQAINKVGNFGNKDDYLLHLLPHNVPVDVLEERKRKAVKILEDVKKELEIFNILYITASVVFFGFFIYFGVLLVFLTKYDSLSEQIIGTVIGEAVSVAMIVPSVMYMVNINKSLGGIDNVISEVKEL